jgi:hypothetical protein
MRRCELRVKGFAQPVTQEPQRWFSVSRQQTSLTRRFYICFMLRERDSESMPAFFV